MAGTWPYQWLYPGPHSKQIAAAESINLPAKASPAAQVLTFQVDPGLRFSLRGLVFAFNGTGWNEGTGDLLFTLSVQAAGTREVDFFRQVKEHRGSANFPWPILGRLEFEPQSVLIIEVENVNVTVTSPAQTVTGILVGHTYPNSESE